MIKLNETVSTAKSNVMGLILGAGAGYLVATKGMKTEKMWVKVASALVGGVVGSMIQAKMSAKKGVPTATIVTAPTK
jgi:outer membrane lipoprotein SlyB